MFRAVLATATVAALWALATPVLADHNKTTRVTTVTEITIPAADYSRWQSQGFSTQDIFYAYNTASVTGKKVDDFFAMRKSGKTWEQIASHCNIPMSHVYGVPTTRVAGARTETREMQREGYVMMERGSLGPYTMYERSLPGEFYRSGYRLTPREYHRLRAQGFTREEVFMIANASDATGLEPRVFADAIYRGLYARGIAMQYNISPGLLTRVNKEWRTPEWAAAVGEDVYNKEKLNVWW